MIGILGGMGTQAGLDFCNKLAILNRGKIDQEYPLFLLYNKSNIPGRPESIGVHTGNLSKQKNNKKYLAVLNSLLKGCKVLQKNKCKFIVIPCNTAHYWYDDLKRKINLPIINMPQEVLIHTKKKCKKIILGCTELPIAIFAFKSFKNIKSSKVFLDPNLILAISAMRKIKKI